MERLVEKLQAPRRSVQAREEANKHASVCSDSACSSSAAEPAQPSSTEVVPCPLPLASGSPSSVNSYYPGASEGAVGAAGQHIILFSTSASIRILLIPRAGSSSLFSAEGIAKIDALIGDTRYSEAVRILLDQVASVAPTKSLGCTSAKSYPFPPNDIIISCINQFFRVFNFGIRLFEEAKVRAAVQAYMLGQPCDEAGWQMALNVILAHELRQREWNTDNQQHTYYLNNALAMVPNIILQPPNPMAIGSLLSLVYYFMFTAKNHVAISLLALATQLILLAGYHNLSCPTDGQGELADVLHRRRIFWHAYVLDHDLMLRIGKPPLINDVFLQELPDELPADGYAVYYYPGNVKLSYFHQQVRLSHIRGRIYDKLYLQSREKMTGVTLENTMAQLDAELYCWWQDIPEMTRPNPDENLSDVDEARFMSLSVLNFMYFQSIVAVHSAAFRLPLLGNDKDVSPSIALCVNAARAGISLLRYQRPRHPFTIYFLYQVAWTVDILFVNIIENRTSVTAIDDLELIEMVVRFFESHDPSHKNVASYHIILTLYEVASSVVLQTTSKPLGQRLPTTATTVSSSLYTNTVDNGNLAMESVLPPSLLPPEDPTQGRGNISIAPHDWFSTGFLQMTDWEFPASL
ncbi:fungal specific transcription factor [Colletotrichum truncatum]|uniref:Fungal specific transcription factor n=1 Tax=Colletotrichum truncatum TaxID=5467 RepID=A0ACC3YSP1_COLTU|nr:fungal specific transcription factor [Colletotrichum truncatum]KAF6782142.1 fungal specific transcription factor [Colletotrichum truncatum]